MDADLERLIQLQTLNDTLDRAQRSIGQLPERLAEIDARVADATQALASARQRQAEAQTARRAIEKDLATVQGRLSKYKDQQMSVKTNKEYQAMQHEIATAQGEVSAFEDRLLQYMFEADDQAVAVKRAEGDVATAQKDAAQARVALAGERETLERQMAAAAAAREQVAAGVSPSAMALYEHIARGRKGSAMSPARGGLCTFCHVRLRPQVFNEVRRNESLIQCDSCHRLLYFEAQPPAAPPAS